MKAKFKILSYYFSFFFLSILVLILFLISLLELTLLRPDYLMNHLEKNNYYQELYLSISDEMSNYIIQAGLEDSVLENIYTQEMVTKSVNSVIYAFYGNQEMKVNTSQVKKNLEDNIVSYLRKNNIEVTDQEALDMFVDQMLDIYSEKIKLTSSLDSVKGLVHKWDFRLKVIFSGLVILVLFFGYIFHRTYKKSAFAVPCFTSSILLLLGDYLFFQRIDVANILFWNESVSKIIKSVLFDLSNLIKVGGLLLIVVGLGAYLFAYILKQPMKQEKKIKIEIK